MYVYVLIIRECIITIRFKFIEGGEKMRNNHDNVILFPKWQSTLEEESLNALKQKRYEDALAKLDELLKFQVNNHEIMIGKLICLMELDRHDEAQQLCEDLLQYKDEHYYHYVHIYLTLLFQTGQYDQLMEQVDYEFSCANSMPQFVQEQFRQLYDLSMTMKTKLKSEQSVQILNRLKKAVCEKNHQKQWQLIERLRKIKSMPTAPLMDLLTNEQIHPVTKTAVFHWLQDKQIHQPVSIHKLGSTLTVVPAEITALESHATFKQTLLLINEIEQINPTLFLLLKKLLYRYAYVRYPIMPASSESVHIARALKEIGSDYLNMPTNEQKSLTVRTKDYIEDIKMCEALYLSIIEE